MIGKGKKVLAVLAIAVTAALSASAQQLSLQIDSVREVKKTASAWSTPEYHDLKGSPVLTARLQGELYALVQQDSGLLFMQKSSSGWTALPSPPMPESRAQSLAAQDGAVHLATDGGFFAYRPVPRDGMMDQGWQGLKDPGLPLLALTPKGQSHLLALAGAREQTNLLTYHTITDTWVNHGPAPDLQADSLSFQGEAILASTGGEHQLLYYSLSQSRKHLGKADYILIALYFLVLIWIGRRFSATSKTADGFFLGGRKVPWWAAGISLYATGTSAISFLAIPTKTFMTNQVYGLGTLFGPVFIILAAYLIVPLLRRIEITSTYEYLERRFNRLVRLFGAFLSVAFQLGGRMSVVLLLPSLALSAVTGIDVFSAIIVMGVLSTLYTVSGGISAVIWTDVLQVVILLGGALLAYFLMVGGTDGGWQGYLQINQEYGKFEAVRFGWNWTMPIIWVFVLNQLSTQITFPSDQVMVQRVLSTPTVGAARKSYILLGLIVVPGTILFHLLGSSLFSFFHSHPEIMSPEMQNDQIFPLYIVEVLPAGISGLLIAALFAACMSTLDSSMHSVSTVVMTDFYGDAMSEKRKLRFAKWITAVVGLIGTIIALLFATLDIKSLFDLWMEIIALIGGGFGGVFILGMFTRRATSGGVMTGALFSILATWLFREFTDAHFMLYSSVAVFSCIFVGYLASLVMREPARDLEQLTIYSRP